MYIRYLCAPLCWPLPAHSFLSTFHFQALIIMSAFLIHTVLVFFISSILSLFFLFFLFPSSLTFPVISATFSSILSKPSALHSFLCPLFLPLHTLHLHTLSFPPRLLPVFLPSTPSSTIAIVDVLPGWVADACLPGFWGAAGVCNDHGKTYALYAITVVRRSHDGSEDCWKTYRRYSDFHDFHMRVTEQVCVYQGFSFSYPKGS